ncbi:SDR family NAD(P)-dependent oxidoreductase [Nakamurella lactea]|uniref:SDR family NAD(P)-dependent oxidoreductase n=1 Tax=Nakamurella lactea TaxID=459515 RepID=UPI000427CA6B|nr:SDR family NAD(P)-dependent oxidoreductase [Nakamurella lactea]
MTDSSTDTDGAPFEAQSFDPQAFDIARYGPWAVIVGGSEGVGARFAELLADAGLNLLLIARKPAPLAAIAESARSRGVRVRTMAVDLLEPGAADRIADAAADLDVGLVVVNAGANSYRGEFVESDPAGVQRVIDLSITAPLELCRHFGKRMKDRGSGGILLVGSLAGYLGHAGIGIYAAAKAFARIFAEGLWLELRPFDVDVLHLVLGLTDTPAMHRAGLRLDGAADPLAVAAQGLAQLPDGPVRVVAGNERLAARRSGLDRAELVTANAEASRRMLGG